MRLSHLDQVVKLHDRREWLLSSMESVRAISTPALLDTRDALLWAMREGLTIVDLQLITLGVDPAL